MPNVFRSHVPLKLSALILLFFGLIIGEHLVVSYCCFTLIWQMYVGAAKKFARK